MVGGRLFAVSFHQWDRIRHCWVWITGQLTWSTDYAPSLSCSGLHTLSCLLSCTHLNILLALSHSLASAPYSCLLHLARSLSPSNLHTIYWFSSTLPNSHSRSKSCMLRLSSLSGMSRLLHISSARYALLRGWWIVDHLLLRACVQQ